MELPNESSGDLDDSGAGVDNSKGTDLIKEVSSKRIIVGAINLFITSRLCHLIAKIQDFCQDDAPERKSMSEFPYPYALTIGHSEKDCVQN